MISRTLTAVVSVVAAADEALHLLQTQVRPHRAEAGEEFDLSDEEVVPPKVLAENLLEEAPAGSVKAAYDAQGETKSEVANLKFGHMEYSNLGGLGPSTDKPANVRYKNVAKNGKDKIDMILESNNFKTAKPYKTGVFGASAIVNIQNGHTVDFTARFIDAKTDKPVNMMAFHLSFMDLDTGKEAGQEELTIGGFTNSYLLDDTELTQVEMDDGRTRFIAGEPGVGADNPADPILLSDVQAKRTVSFKFPAGLSTFTFSYKVAKVSYTDYDADTEGRHFLLSGMSSLYFCDAKPVVTDYNMASVIHSNLGGLGPDFGAPPNLLFKHVALVENDQMLDLKIENLTEYIPANTANNGLNGEFAQLNIRGGSSTKFRFTFLEHGTDKPYQMEWNFFTIFDLDHGKKFEKYKERVEVKGFATHFLTETSELHLTEHGDKWYTYASSTWGTGKDNPTDPMNLSQQQKDRSVTLLYHGKSHYDARFSADKPKANGRNFLFSGKSGVVFC